MWIKAYLYGVAFFASLGTIYFFYEGPGLPDGYVIDDEDF